MLDGIDEQMEVLCKQNKDVECVTLSIALMLYLTEKDDTNGHWETAKPAIKKLLKCCVKKRGYGDTFGGRSKSTEMQVTPLMLCIYIYIYIYIYINFTLS